MDEEVILITRGEFEYLEQAKEVMKGYETEDYWGKIEKIRQVMNLGGLHVLTDYILTKLEQKSA